MASPATVPGTGPRPHSAGGGTHVGDTDPEVLDQQGDLGGRGSPSGEPKTRWTTAVTATPTARLASTATGSPYPDTMVVTASTTTVIMIVRCTQRLR